MKARLQTTRHYAQFSFAKENRPVDVLNLSTEHKKLRASLQKYGWLPAFPMMVKQIGTKLVVVDGQHRLTFAKEFGLDVYYVLDSTQIDIAEVNEAQGAWKIRDYANRWANDGRKDYRAALDFAEQYGLPVGTAFSLLAGTSSFANLKNRYRKGDYKITSADLATRVASCYQQLCQIKRGIKHDNLVAAIYACCHVSYFEESRIIETARRRPEMITSCGTREAFLQMLGEIYNHGRKTRLPIAFDAAEAMREKQGPFAGKKGGQ